MKILIVMDPGISIPVKGYGGHERLVEMFAKEYLRQGHEVDCLITSGSTIEGCSVINFGKEGFPPKKVDAQKAIYIAWKFLWSKRKKYDLVHNFGRLLYLLPILNSNVFKIMTYGREINSGNIRKILKFPNKNVAFTGCSKSLLARVSLPGNWHAVYNAIEFNKYDLVDSVAFDAPLVFLGRIEKVKGCHTAIKVAKAAGRKLIIAGNVSPLEEEKAYFDAEIKPHIDGNKVEYLGAVNDAEKNELLGKCAALLMPITWNEPFGIVMIEAMACGTPVIAFNMGSVPEVISEAVTGFIVEDKEEMIQKINVVHAIERSRCRATAMKRFDVKVIAQKYLDLVIR